MEPVLVPQCGTNVGPGIEATYLNYNTGIKKGTTFGPALWNQNTCRKSELGLSKSGTISGPRFQQIWMRGVSKFACQVCTPAASCGCGPGAPSMATASPRAQAQLAVMQIRSAQIAIAKWCSREAGAPFERNAVEPAPAPPSQRNNTHLLLRKSR